MYRVEPRKWIARITITWGILSALMMFVQGEQLSGHDVGSSPGPAGAGRCDPRNSPRRLKRPGSPSRPR